MEDRKTRADWIKNLAENNQYKAECVLCDDSIWPTPIAKCYNDLLHLMEEGNVYGSLLQIRDLYETILKIPVLAALIYICGVNKESLLNDSDLLEKWIYFNLIYHRLDFSMQTQVCESSFCKITYANCFYFSFFI